VFNLSGSEIMFLLLAGLVVLGPERLPGVIRQVGRLYGELRRMAAGFEKEFKGTFQEPIDEIRKSAQDLKNTMTDDFGQVDQVPSPPMNSARSATPEEIAPVNDEQSSSGSDIPEVDSKDEQT
jgi:sec-independent protein translocase protein TatB